MKILSAAIGAGQSDTLKNLSLATGGAAIRPTVAASG
jgi:hypothetical protein